MYVAIEGIKGSGKSSVLARVTQQLDADAVSYAMLRPYGMDTSGSPLDRIFAATGNLWPRAAVNWFYARRSDRRAARLHRRGGLVIGDRSIVTSYVTNWDQRDPLGAMDRVDRLERRIALPDHVVLLDAPVDLALQRIGKRPKRRHGGNDERRERLAEAARAYRAMAEQSARFGLGRVTWHLIDASRPLDVVSHEVLTLITPHGATA